jgi:hypothetical protein
MSEEPYPPAHDWTFDLMVDRERLVMDYVCRTCGTKEHGGGVPNPGLYGRMRAHLDEGHDIPYEQRFRITHVETSSDSAEIYFKSLETSDESGAEPTEITGSPQGAPPRTRWMPDRSVYLSFIVDTNCVNARQKDAAVNTLEKWAEDGVISLLTTEVAQNEMLAGNDNLRTEKAYRYIFTISEITTEREERTRREIEQILFPAGASDQNHRNDVEIVFNATKYLRPLVTNDGDSKSQPGGILGNAAALAALGCTVLPPDEAVVQVRKAIDARDSSARKMSSLTGEPIPEWVDLD